jgi:hypothetical protein
MSKLGNKIKKKIKGLVCIEHQCQVEISITNGKMVFHICCKKFENIIKKTKDEVIRDYLTNGGKRTN